MIKLLSFIFYLYLSDVAYTFSRFQTYGYFGDKTRIFYRRNYFQV